MSSSALTLGIVIGGVALGTFALRLSFIGWMDGREVPAWLSRTLRFVPPSVLAALTLPAVLNAGVGDSMGGLIPPLLAAAIAVGVAWRTGHMLFPIGAGMVALWTLQALIPN